MTRVQHWGQQIWRGLRGDRLVFVLFTVAAVMNGLTWLTMARVAARQPALLPLHATIYFGPDLTVRGKSVFVLPLAGIAILIFNALISGLDERELWRRSWSVITVALNILLLATSLALLYISQTSL